MIPLDRRILTNWQGKIGAQTLLLAEHDLRLIWALAGIYGDSKLCGRLAFKGGTVLNKAYFGESSRLSVDLDFNLVGPPRQVVREGKEIRLQVEGIMKEQDPNYKVQYKYSARQTALEVRYVPLFGEKAQPIKLEISVRESVPILGLVKKMIPGPEEKPAIEVTTYWLDELLATKIHALYSRKKGRDVFDLDCAIKMNLNRVTLRKMAYYYFYRSGRILNWDVVKANLEEKIGDKKLGEDIKPFLRPDVEFSAPEAMRRIIADLEFLGQPDERDTEFLALAKGLVGRTTSPKKLAKTSHVVHPIKTLMDPIPITPEAAAMTVDDIRLET